MTTELWWNTEFRRTDEYRAALRAIWRDGLQRLHDGEDAKSVAGALRLAYALAYEQEVERNPLLAAALRGHGWNRTPAGKRLSARRDDPEYITNRGATA